MLLGDLFARCIHADEANMPISPLVNQTAQIRRSFLRLIHNHMHFQAHHEWEEGEASIDHLI